MLDSALFDSNIIKLEQQAQFLILLCEDNSVIVYEWRSRRLVQVLNQFVDDACSMTSGPSQIIVGTRDGNLKMSSLEWWALKSILYNHL